MKKLRSITLFLALFLLISSGGDDGTFEAQINALKSECKALLKNARYEGSRITYYNSAANKQTKHVEVFMFLNNEYLLAFSTKKCSVPLTIRLYDAAPNVDERMLISEFKNYEGKTFVVSSLELNRIYRKKVPEVERLRNVHIEYAIGSGKADKEAIVLVIGYK